MTVLDEIRAEIVARKESAERRFKAAATEWETAKAELAAHDRAVAAMGDPADNSAVVRRHSVQRTVMPLFDPGAMLAEAEITEKTGLPQNVVHQFLLRAVRFKMLRPLGDDVYALPLRDLPPQAAADG